VFERSRLSTLLSIPERRPILRGAWASCSNRTRKLLHSNRNRQKFFCPSWILCGFVAFIRRIAVGRWWNPWSLLWESWDFCCCCCVLFPCSYGDGRSPQRHLHFCNRFCSNSSCFFKGLVLFCFGCSSTGLLITECWAFAGSIFYVGSRERNAFIPVNFVKILQVVEAEEEETAVPLPMTAGRGRSSGISRMRRRPAAGASSQSVLGKSLEH